ncbi:proton-translocating NADH-quinone oxidoreductase chain L [Meiothermus ruber H328]|nr:proton-translocating NADH-quinone oxidoreductase chain L [Meiothermus ruber H328]
MQETFLLPLIIALPLLGFVLLGLFGKRIGEPAAGWLASLLVLGSFLLGLVLLLQGGGPPPPPPPPPCQASLSASTSTTSRA